VTGEPKFANAVNFRPLEVPVSDSAAATALASHLMNGERLLWSGRPRQGLLLRPADALLIPASLLWCALTVFLAATALRSGAPPARSFIALVFVAVGLYMVVGRFLVDAWLRAGTAYGVTDRRVLIASHGLGGRVKSLGARAITDLTVSEDRRGGGVILFGPVLFGVSVVAAWLGVRSRLPIFELGSGVREVYDLIRRTQAAA
jgi:hypothetical protein